MELHLEGQVLSVAQLGPDFLILDKRMDLPPSVGELKLQIDEKEVCSAVHLVKGCNSTQPRTPIAHLATIDHVASVSTDDDRNAALPAA